jgi:hypothetical protein
VNVRVLLLAVVVAGCTSGPAGSCNVTTTASVGYTYCIDYLGSGYDPNSVKAACAANQSTWSPDRCPSTSDGLCRFYASTAMEVTNVYDTSAADGGTVDLQGICQNAGGTFSSM